MKLAPSSLCVHIYCDKEDKVAPRGTFFYGKVFAYLQSKTDNL